MKRNLVRILVIAALTLTSAWANKIVFTDAPPDWSGGPFKAQFQTDSGTNIGPSFLTFCLERNEFVVWNVKNDYTIDSGAKQGGGGAVNGIDPISIGTAWLYYQFRTVAGFASTDAKKMDLQRTIWYLEAEGNEGGYSYLASPMYTQASTALSGSYPDITVDANGAYGVYAINPIYQGVLRQSMLGVPDGGFTLVLLGLGLSLLGFAARRLV